MTSPKPKITQTIKYTGNESEYCSPITGENVVIHSQSGKHTHGSSKVKLINRIDYNWEFRYYHGRLVSAHISGKVFAYSMKGKEGGMVRVCNQETNQRALIKNLKDDVKDLAFAYSRDEIILGCVDSEGNVLIYEINDQPNSLQYSLLLHIYHPSTSCPQINYKIIWCPFLNNSDDEDPPEDDPEKMFVLLNGNQAEIYNVSIINSKHGIGPFDTNDTFEGCIEIVLKEDLVDAAFSSDGTAIAIASLDGFVKFFQLYMVDPEKQKCLHEWRPHEGKSLSSIIFIDNVLEYSSECWKFTITGANYNSEIKLWSCETWTCLQTINFQQDNLNIIPNLYLNMSIDYTGQYLVLSDINNRILYILKLLRNDGQQTVYVTTFCKFLLPSAFLSFHILEAKTKKVPFSFSNSSEDLFICDDQYNEDCDEENEVENVAEALKMLIIQPKKFQECNILFQPENLMHFNTENDVQEQEKVPKLDDLHNTVSLLIQQQISKSQNAQSDDLQLENVDSFPKNAFASGGSSPSREVQEILSLNNSNYNSEDFYDLIQKQEEETEPQKDYQIPKTQDVAQEMVWPKIRLVNPENLQELGDNLQEENLKSVNYRLSSLENAIREQSIVLNQMQEKGNNFSQDLEQALKKQNLQFALLLENFDKVQKNREQNLQDNVLKILNKQIPLIFAQELKPIIIPAVHNLLEQFRKQIEGQFAQKLQNTDLVLRESVQKALNLQMLSDSLSVSVTKMVSPILEKCYRDVVYSSLVPSWERVCSSMFHQINETFTKGTKEYTVSVENYMDRQKHFQEKSKDIIVQMQTVSDKMKANTDKLAQNLTLELSKQYNYSLKSMQDKLSLTIKEAVNEQVNQAFKNHATAIEDSFLNAVRSRTVTPSPHSDSQATLNQIQQYLSKGSYDDAFQLALSAENLHYVIYACEKSDLNTLFANECLLQQSCLLALIQQLSMDLHKNTDLKLSYIRAAILGLSTDTPHTKQFIPKVAKDLLKQLSVFIASNPPMKHLKDAKLLKMAAESMFK